jgi:hypothetical protein
MVYKSLFCLLSHSMNYFEEDRKRLTSGIDYGHQLIARAQSGNMKGKSEVTISCAHDMILLRTLELGDLVRKEQTRRAALMMAFVPARSQPPPLISVLSVEIVRDLILEKYGTMK